MTEKEKFWFETLRTILFGVIGFIGVYIIAESFANDQKYQFYVDQEKIQLREKLIEEYLIESYQYTSMLYDALYKRQNQTDQLDLQYDKYRNLLNRMKVYFGPQVDGIIDEINNHFIPLLNPRHPVKNWRAVRKALKQKNIMLGETALREIHLSL